MDQPETEPSFEEALGLLDRIVESLERGEPELSSALAKYEKGVKLLTQCYRLLDQAEHSVALLTGVDQQGQPADGSVRCFRTDGSPHAGSDANPIVRPRAHRPKAAIGQPRERRPRRRSPVLNELSSGPSTNLSSWRLALAVEELY